ncbi:MAG: hypothetical protein Q9157_005667 [Trypethelium eluteriae]
MSPLNSESSYTRGLLSLKWVGLLGVLLGVVYVVYRAIYNLYLSPLAKYPGPRLAAVTRLWWLRQQFSGRFPIVVHDLHLKHGEIVRIAPNELSFTGAAAWKDIYGFRNGLPENRKDPAENTDADHRYPTIINASRVDHGRLRKLLSNAFSDKVLKGQEPVLLHYIDLLVARLTELHSDGKPFNLYVTFDIIGHLAFDEPFDCLQNTEYHPWMSMIFNAIVYVHHIRCLQRFFDIRSLILRLMPQKMVKRRQWHIELVEEKVRRRKTRNPEYVDFMSHLLIEEEKGRLTIPDLVANANLMVIAGSETTATILSGTIWLLLKNPRVMNKLLEEVRGSFTSGDQINIARLSELRYINAVTDESFRLYPPAAGSHPRRTPAEGAYIVGDWLPGDVCLAKTRT